MKFILAWARTFSPVASKGLTIHSIESEARYPIAATAELKNAQLFKNGGRKYLVTNYLRHMAEDKVIIIVNNSTK